MWDFSILLAVSAIRCSHWALLIRQHNNLNCTYTYSTECNMHLFVNKSLNELVMTYLCLNHIHKLHWGCWNA